MTRIYTDQNRTGRTDGTLCYTSLYGGGHCSETIQRAAMVLSRWPNSNCCIVLFRYCFGENKWAIMGHFVSIRKERVFNHKGHEGTLRNPLPLMTRITLIYTDLKSLPRMNTDSRGLGTGYEEETGTQGHNGAA